MSSQDFKDVKADKNDAEYLLQPDKTSWDFVSIRCARAGKRTSNSSGSDNEMQTRIF